MWGKKNTNKKATINDNDYEDELEELLEEVKKANKTLQEIKEEITGLVKGEVEALKKEIQSGNEFFRTILLKVLDQSADISKAQVSKPSATELYMQRKTAEAAASAAASNTRRDGEHKPKLP